MTTKAPSSARILSRISVSPELAMEVSWSRLMLKISVEMENVAAAWKACLDYFSLTATTTGERAFSTGEIARYQVKDCERENVGVNI